MIEFNAIVLLGRDAGGTGKRELADGTRFLELRVADAERISLAERQYGRRGHLPRILGRFGHGLRFFALEESGSLVAWFWVAHSCPRYFDELCWLVDLGAEYAWARDAFVVPERRGRRLLSGLMDMAARQDERPVRYLSDVSVSNWVSLRAHKSLGFERLATVRSLAVGPLIIRSLPPPCIPAPNAIRPGHRVLWLSPEDRAWHKAHIA